MPNKNGGYGRGIVDALAALSPVGKVFVVGASTVVNVQQAQALYTGDSQGQLRMFSTITLALAAAVADRGDVIYVLPGHAETISAAAGIAIAKNGVSLVGLGTGSARPTITFGTSTAATLTITAANVSMRNFIFTQSLDLIVSPIVISGANCSITDNYFMVANASFQAVQMILTTAGASNLSILRNRFYGTVDAGTTAAITLVGGDNITINDNDFIGAYTLAVGGIQCITTLTTNIVVKRNTIVNRTASATKAITLLTGSTGVITGNFFGIGSGAAPITADATWWGFNYNAAAVATNATLV